MMPARAQTHSLVRILRTFFATFLTVKGREGRPIPPSPDHRLKPLILS